MDFPKRLHVEHKSVGYSSFLISEVNAYAVSHNLDFTLRVGFCPDGAVYKSNK